MEARIGSTLVCALALLSLGAGYRTQNFIVDAPSPELAREVCDSAEKYRHDLAIEWLGKPLADWPEPCPIRVTVGNIGAGGATSFMFDHGRPFGWTMSVQGTRERVLDSVLPHEVTHAIFATHFGRPLPRWADEGACTTVEHRSEKQKQEDNLLVFLTTQRGIAFNQMFAMTEYPKDVLPLYSQGYSLARFLIAQGGKRKFVDYVGEGMKSKNWTTATKQHYGFENLSELQLTWVEWVRAGSSDKAAEQYALARTPKTEMVAAIDRAALDRSAQPASATRELPGKLAQTDLMTPVTRLASNAGPNGKGSGAGWYARKRDELRPASSLAARQSSDATGNQPLDTSHVELPSSVLVARPQPLSQPQQTIIEWSRPPQSSTVPGSTKLR